MSEERDVKQEINKCSPNNFQFADDIEVRSMRAAGSGGEARHQEREGEQRDSSRGEGGGVRQTARRQRVRLL